MDKLITYDNLRNFAYVNDKLCNEKWKNLGVKYISYSVDVGIFCEAVGNIVSSWKEQ